jgi:hypothetical protein
VTSLPGFSGHTPPNGLVGFGKHAPARLNHLLGSQTDQIEQLRKLGFVRAPELSLERFADGSAAYLGMIHCEGGLYLQVHQLIEQDSRLGGHVLFCVEAYSYSAVAVGVGTIFRYDSPHDDHNTEHHVHEFGEVGNRETATVRFL